MKKSRIAILTIIILALTATVPLRIHASAPGALIEQAERELVETLRILDNVKWTADNAALGSITAQLNEALKLLEEAKQHASEGRITEANNSAEGALSLIREAKNEAESAEKASLQSVLPIQVYSWILVPVASFLTTLTLTRGYEWHVKRERRKLLNMTIKRKKEKEKK